MENEVARLLVESKINALENAKKAIDKLIANYKETLKRV